VFKRDLSPTPIASIPACTSIFSLNSLLSCPPSPFQSSHALETLPPWPAPSPDPEVSAPITVYPRLEDQDTVVTNDPRSSGIVARGAGSVPRRPRNPGGHLEEERDVSEARVDGNEDPLVTISLSPSRYDSTAFLFTWMPPLIPSRSFRLVPDSVHPAPSARRILPHRFLAPSPRFTFPGTRKLFCTAPVQHLDVLVNPEILSTMVPLLLPGSHSKSSAF